MHKFKTKKSKVPFTMPGGWHEIKFVDGLAIHTKPHTNIELMALLSGKKIKEIEAMTDIETVNYFIGSFEFLKYWPVGRTPEFPLKVSPVIDCDKDKKISLPWVDYYDTFDLGGCTVGQVEDMKHVISEAKPSDDMETVAIYSKICAIYLQPIMNFEDYDFNKAMKFESKVEQMDFKTIANMGAFFLLRLHDLTSGQTNVWKKAHSAPRKLKQELRSLVRRLGFMRR